MSHLEKNSRILAINYKCPNCEAEWADLWSCACDSECPECGTGDIEALDWEDVSEYDASDVSELVRAAYDVIQAGTHVDKDNYEEAREKLARILEIFPEA